MNVVCVAAHMDDEMSSLGTMIKCAARGDKITLITVSNGDKGGQFDPSLPHEEISRIRIAESRSVAQSLGGDYYCLGQEDEYIADTREARIQVTELLRRAKADLVFTCPLNDYNPDHSITGEIVFHAVMLTTVRTMTWDEAPLERTPAMFYMDTCAGQEFVPTDYVDISDVFEKKMELCGLHVSQMANMQTFGGWDLVTYSKVMNRYRGLQCYVDYAEAFRAEMRWPRATPYEYLPKGLHPALRG
ncbi:MAG: PIG-L deacetylase family protein [Anaerolineae bacterium]